MRVDDSSREVQHPFSLRRELGAGNKVTKVAKDSTIQRDLTARHIDRPPHFHFAVEPTSELPSRDIHYATRLEFESLGDLSAREIRDTAFPRIQSAAQQSVRNIDRSAGADPDISGGPTKNVELDILNRTVQGADGEGTPQVAIAREIQLCIRADRRRGDVGRIINVDDGCELGIRVVAYQREREVTSCANPWKQKTIVRIHVGIFLLKGVGSGATEVLPLQLRLIL